MPRNKVILSTLYKSKDVEVFGSGFRKVYALCDKYGIKVSSHSDNGGFSFVFYKDSYGDKRDNNVTVNVSIPANHGQETDQKGNTSSRIPTDRKVYMLLKEDPTQTREVLAQKIGKTVRTIQRALDKLSKEGKIKRIGSNKAGYWEIMNE